MHDPAQELLALVLRHASHGYRELLPRVTLWTALEPSPPVPVVYEPMLYFTLQGVKRMSVGQRRVEHRPGTCLLAAIDVPVVCAVTECSRERPYLGIALELDRAAVASLVADMAQDPRRPTVDTREEREPISICPTTRALDDALLRLLTLVEAPLDEPLLRSMFERELLYRALQSEHGTALRQFVQADSRVSQIQRAVSHIRAHLTDTIPIKTLAAVAGMSATSFHRHFKAVTGLSPLAYHKQMRLREARARLIGEPGAVASVAFSVGYESVSQFSREYARQFGMTPARDAARLRAG